MVIVMWTCQKTCMNLYEKNSPFFLYVNHYCSTSYFYFHNLKILNEFAYQNKGNNLIIRIWYSITADLNFNTLKTFCLGITPKKFYKLSLPYLHINKAFLSNADSVKYLGFTFVNIRVTAICCRCLKIFQGCILIELGRSFCDYF